MQQGLAQLRGEMQERFREVHDRLDNVELELREVRAIQDAHGKELNRLVEGVESISRKLTRVGEELLR